MALKVRFAKPAEGHHLRSRILWGLLAAVGCVALVGISVFTFFYIKYARIVDERLKQLLILETPVDKSRLKSIVAYGGFPLQANQVIDGVTKHLRGSAS